MNIHHSGLYLTQVWYWIHPTSTVWELLAGEVNIKLGLSSKFNSRKLEKKYLTQATWDFHHKATLRLSSQCKITASIGNNLPWVSELTWYTKGSKPQEIQLTTQYNRDSRINVFKQKIQNEQRENKKKIHEEEENQFLQEWNIILTNEKHDHN